MEWGFPGCGSVLILALVIPLGAATQPKSAREAFELGQQALTRGDLAAAEQDFREVLAAEPDNVGAHGNLAVVYMRRRQWEPALAELHAAERLAPKMAGIRLNIGLVYYRQADYRHAIPPFESVLREQESNQARYLLGLCYFFTEKYADAAKTLEPLWAEESQNLNYLYVLSIAASEAGRAELDQQATARMIEIGQDTALFHLIIGKAHLAHQEYSRAFDELQHAARIDPKLPFVHYFLGALYRQRGDFETAKQEFLKDVSIEPDMAYNYDQLGSICYALDEMPDAKRYYQEALRRDPGLSTSDYGLAKIYKQENQYAAALKVLNAAGAIDPQSASVHYLRGQVLFAMGRKAEAKPEFDEAARLKQAVRDELERKISGQHPSDPQLAGEDHAK